MPEIQDVFVLPSRRREGVATQLTRACEELAASRGHDRISLSYGIDNVAARRLYERCGFVDAGAEPVRVHGTILVRGKTLEVDDTLIYFVKLLD